MLSLNALGLGARPNLTLVFQEKHKRWMIAGEEGGGSTGEVGHYIGFAGVTPVGLAVSIPIQSLIPNSTQRRVISQEMIRAQIFRYGSSCDLLVTHHYLAAAAKEERDRLWSVGFYSMARMASSPQGRSNPYSLTTLASPSISPNIWFPSFKRSAREQ